MILNKLVLFLVDKLSVTVVFFFQLESVLDGQVFMNPSAEFPHCQLLNIVFRNGGGVIGNHLSTVCSEHLITLKLCLNIE